MITRTKKPSKNPYYLTIDAGGYSKCIKGKPTDKNANVLANCVGYANGRFAEIIGDKKIQYQFIMNAESFIKHARSWGLEISKIPTLGGIMVFEGVDTKTKKRAGHVFVVEELRGKDKIYTSESSYGGAYFYNKIRTKENNWNLGKNYKFIGCIVNPKIGRVIYEEPKENNFKTTSDLYVRTGAGTNYGIKLVKDLTKDGKKNATSQNANALAVYRKGTIFTAIRIIQNNNGTWAETPSGFVCIEGKSGKYYCVKC